MKKKAIIFLIAIIGVIVILLIAIAAINGNNLDSLKNDLGRGKPIGEGELIKMIKDSNEFNTSYEKLAKYSYNDFMINLQHKKWSSINSKNLINSSFGMNDIISFNSLFPIEKLTVINNDCIYAEYKLEKDDRPFHAFVVFERSVLNEKGNSFERWHYYGEIYFAYSDISSDQLSSLEGKRITINSLPFMIDMRFTPYALGTDANSSLHFEETILIKDGVAVISYIADSFDSDEIAITDLAFIPYGKSDERYLGNSFVKNSFPVFK
jgi:hypothetical protein